MLEQNASSGIASRAQGPYVIGKLARDNVTEPAGSAGPRSELGWKLNHTQISGVKNFNTANIGISRPCSTMLKRPSEQDLDNDGRCSKRFRPQPQTRDRLSSLSDELILRTFSFLPISQLVVCERCAHSVFSARRLADHEDFLIG